MVFPSFSKWGHCGHMTWNTANVLQRNSLNELLGNTAGKLAGKILNVPGVYRVGTSLVLYPFPCNVLAVYQLGTLALAPSGSSTTAAPKTNLAEIATLCA